jgi:hypothetical protein
MSLKRAANWRISMVSNIKEARAAENEFSLTLATRGPSSAAKGRTY